MIRIMSGHQRTDTKPQRMARIHLEVYHLFMLNKCLLNK